ncbi:MAG: glycosyltransferase, partial [Flavobacteriales bacterium]
MKRVKVVIPCRNEEAYIGKCLDSLIQCNHDNVELKICVVDGMSDDNTRAIVSQYAANYPNIQLVDNSRKTTPYALNLGLQHLD